MDKATRARGAPQHHLVLFSDSFFNDGASERDVALVMETGIPGGREPIDRPKILIQSESRAAFPLLPE